MRDRICRIYKLKGVIESQNLLEKLIPVDQEGKNNGMWVLSRTKVKYLYWNCMTERSPFPPSSIEIE